MSNNANGAANDALSHQHEAWKPLPEEFYATRLSEASKRRREDGIRALLYLETRPGVISLLAGKPSTGTFPFADMQFSIRDPYSDSDELVKVALSDSELHTGLQYNYTEGLPALREWFYGLQERQHGRQKGEGWEIMIGAGSQDLVFKAAHALLNPGDSVLVETPAYAGVLTIFHSLQCDMIEVASDSDGIRSDSLRSILSNWPSSKPKPKILYTVPYGGNPTGTTATLERRQEVSALSKEYGFLIFEDDPYFNLYFGSSNRPPSYFALERQLPEGGRVVRFDSLSKVMSSGMRVGFVSAAAPILKAMAVHSMEANLQPSTLSQVIALKVLSTWGYDGYALHVKKIGDFYHKKRDVFEAAMQRHLSGLVEWTKPEAGMFFWFKLLLSDPESGVPATEEDDDSALIIRTKALERGVLALPGTAFLPNGGKTAYVRASFSLLPAEDVDEALRRLREVILDTRKARQVV